MSEWKEISENIELYKMTQTEEKGSECKNINKKKRCKWCSNFYVVNLSCHVCDDCYQKCVSTDPIKAKPK